MCNTNINKLIRSDAKAYLCRRKINFINYLYVYLFNCGFRAIFLYRFAYAFRIHGNRLFSRYLTYKSRKKYGIEISPMAKIGTGFRIAHGSGVVIGNYVVIGDNALIYQGVTIGSVTPELSKKPTETPQIGADVIIYAGAKILGPIQIGDRAVIAANAVVINDVAEGAIVGGIPAKTIGKRQVF